MTYAAAAAVLVAVLAFVVLHSRVSGWRALWLTYSSGCPESHEIARFEHQTIGMRWLSWYQSCVMFIATSDGLCIRISPFASLGSPNAIFVPWDDISMVKTNRLIFPVRLSFAKVSSTPIFVSWRLGKALSDIARSRSHKTNTTVSRVARRSSVWRNVVAATFFSTFFVFFLSVLITDLIPARALLVVRGEETIGVVKQVEIGRRVYLTYEFSIDANTFSGMALDPGVGNPPIANLRSGDAVKVFYDPADPTRSTAGEPSQPFFKDLAMVVAVSVVLGLLATWVIQRR